MTDPVKVAVIYYSSTGNVHALAKAAAEGAKESGAEVRLHRTPELAPEEAIRANEGWWQHYQGTQDVPEATLDDLTWADVVLLGTPTRYGNVTSQMKQFIDTTGPLWSQGLLADKVYAGFTSTATMHGGQESTLLALYNTMHHWGGIVVAPGYTDPVQFELGNPYGASYVAGQGGNPPGDVELRAARYMAQRCVRVAAALKAGAEEPYPVEAEPVGADVQS